MLLNIDNTDPPQFQEIRQERVRLTLQTVIMGTVDNDDIVGNQPVAPINQLKGTFTLSDPRLTDDQGSMRENIDQYAMNLSPLGQSIFQES
jgi:hypothetical protein